MSKNYIYITGVLIHKLISMQKVFQWFLLSSILLFGCHQEPTINICDQISQIIEDDQFYRTKHFGVISPFFFVMDSLLIAEGYPEGIDELSSYPSEMNSEIRRRTSDVLLTRPEPPQNTLDSIWALQWDVDRRNVHKMTSIIETYGLATLDTLHSGCAMEGLFVFVHTPDELKELVRSLIDPELQDYDSARYDHIMWHLNGRESRNGQ